MAYYVDFHLLTFNGQKVYELPIGDFSPMYKLFNRLLVVMVGFKAIGAPFG